MHTHYPQTLYWVCFNHYVPPPKMLFSLTLFHYNTRFPGLNRLQPVGATSHQSAPVS